MATISVIIPAYNSEKTIKKTIESVLKQTFSDWELVIINDGSEDQTLNVISEIKDDRIKVFSYPNAGVSVSRNRGVKQAKGEYIAFLDHDDLWTPNKLETQYKALQNYPEAAIAYSWTDHCDEFDQVIYLGRHIAVSGNIYANLLVDNFLDTASNPLIRKQALDQIGGFDSTINSSGEWDLWIRLSARYSFVNVPETQVFHRISNQAMSAKIEPHLKECLEVVERSFNQAPESLQNLKKASLANIYKYLLCKSLEGKLTRQKGLQSLNLTWKYIKYEPQLKFQTKFILMMLLKGCVPVVLPSNQAHALLTRLKS